MFKFADELYRQTIEECGEENQHWIAVEEMSELAKEISKHQRNKGSKLNIIEEMADVEIMLEQLRIMHGISEKDVQRAIYEKEIRLMKNLNGCKDESR